MLQSIPLSPRDPAKACTAPFLADRVDVGPSLRRVLLDPTVGKAVMPRLTGMLPFTS